MENQETKKDLTLTQRPNSSLTISKAVSESKPVRQLTNEGYSQQTIEGALAARIAEASAMLHIGGNLGSGESIKIAQMLIQEYPTSSLEDFTLMLQRGIIGRYGKVYGFDISVVFGWMGMYMEEWAEEKERQLSKQKGEQMKQLIDELDTPYNVNVDKLLDDLKESLRDSKVKSVPKLTQEEIKSEGQSDPPKPKGIYYPSSPLERHVMMEKKIQWARECTDLHTGKLLEGALTFNEWLLTDKK